MTDYDPSIVDELIVESKEHLESIEPDLMALEGQSGQLDPEAVNRIFRAVHSIKGGFGFFGMHGIKNLAHSMENVLDRLRMGKLEARADVVDALLAGIDKLRVMIDDAQASESISIEQEQRGLLALLDAGPSPAAAAPRGDSEPDDGPYQQALALLRRPEQQRLDPDTAQELIATLRRLLEEAPEEAKPTVEDALQDCEACEKAMGLDGLLREGIAEKLETIAPALRGEGEDEAAESSKRPQSAQSDATDKAASGDTPRPAAASQSLRVRVDLLDRLMNLAGELVLSRNRIKRTLSERLSNGMAGSSQLERLSRHLEASRERLHLAAATAGEGCSMALGRAVAQEFDGIEACLRQLLDSSFADLPGLGGAVQDIDSVTSELQGGIMGTRMQPVGSIFSKFPRVIRDMSRQLGKEIELAIQGQGVELDKSIVEALTDPLTHLIRNSADHGIEKPVARRKAGKPAQGRIELIARHEGGQVFIEIVDDGAGIDVERVKSKAVERNMLRPDEARALSDREALRLIFAPGFSTAQQVSDVSGRGVGMDVVRSNIEKIGGTVDIDSSPGQGSRITLKLPLTLAIMPALVIENEGRVFAVPQVDIEELVRIRACDASRRIEKLQSKPVMRLREKILPLVSLNEVLGIRATYPEPAGEGRAPERRHNIADRRAPELLAERQAEPRTESETQAREQQDERRRNRRSAFNIIVLRVGPNRYGLIVESLRDSEEIVVKPLPDYLKRCPAYAGATIMGDGSVAMILDAGGLAEAAQLRFGGDLESAEAAQQEDYVRRSLREKQTLLLFRNGASERFAVSLAMIRRIEKIASSDIERVHDKEYLKYEDSSLRLLRLHDFLPVAPPEQGRDECYVLVPRLVRHPMGIIVSEVEDVLETETPLDRETIQGTGVLGSFVQQGTLYICLDVYGMFEAAEPDIYRHGDAEALRGRRILLAEDTAFFRSVESTYLRELGCEVETASDGEEAWARLNERAYDALVTDIQMPRLDGLGLAARVRGSKRLERLPILALTSMTRDEDRRRILEAGLDAYEAKLDKESLRGSLERLIPAS